MEKTISNVSQEKQRILKIRKRSNYIFISLALFVFTVTVAALILPAITSENETFCGYLEEHTHTEACYTRTLICNFSEESASEEHTHSQECYEFSLSCEIDEHTHALACMSDPDADVESTDEINTSMGSVSLSGVPARDILSIALSQIGYSESSANYKVLDDGQSVRGYTRYGQWLGDPYADWNAIFVSFCANFAKVDAIPKDADIQKWITLQSTDEDGLYRDTSYIPGGGDIAFFDTDADGIADRTAIVEEVCLSDDIIRVIEGDSYNSVKSNEYALTGDSIIGYIQLSSRIQQGDGIDSDPLNNAEGTFVSHPEGNKVYQYSSHRLDGAPLLCYALIHNNKNANGDWSANTVEWSANANANYTVAYLLKKDRESFGGNYATLDISSSAYSDAATKLSAIVSHSYPFITAEQMKLELKKAYKNKETDIDLSCCSENEFIAATQWAIWDCVNNTDTDHDINGAEFPANNSDAINPLSSVGHTDGNTVKAHVRAIRDWIISRTLPDKAEIIDKKVSTVRNVDGTYTANLTVTLSRELLPGEELLISKALNNTKAIDTVYGEGTSSFTVSFDRLSADELLNAGIYMQVITDKMQVFVHESDSADLISAQMREITYDMSLSLDVATTSVDVKALWTDAPHAADGIDVVLYADGKAYSSPVNLNEGNGWSHSWDSLIKYDSSGEAINYTLEASTVPGYLTTTVRSEGEPCDINYTLTNTLSERAVSIKVRSEWIGRTDGKYPKSLTVQLLQNGIDYSSPITLDAENNWAYIWEDLPRTVGNETFEYSLKELELNGYTSELILTEEDGIQVITVSNSWSPEHLPITLEVVDINNPTIQLTGVVFDLFRISDGDGAVIVPGTTDIMGVKERTVITDKNGRFVLDDLLVGNTYCLVETASSIGYARLTEPIVVSIERTDDRQGVAKVLRGGSLAYVLEDDGNCTLSVKNRESYLLPETGGAGILIYYVSGLSLITIAIFYITIKNLNFFRRKRK